MASFVLVGLLAFAAPSVSSAQQVDGTLDAVELLQHALQFGEETLEPPRLEDLLHPEKKKPAALVEDNKKKDEEEKRKQNQQQVQKEKAAAKKLMAEEKAAASEAARVQEAEQEAAAEQWRLKSLYLVAEPGQDCPTSWQAITHNRTECEIAAAAHNFSTLMNVWKQSFEEHPQGCFLHILSGHVNWNWNFGPLNDEDQRICMQDTCDSACKEKRKKKEAEKRRKEAAKQEAAEASKKGKGEDAARLEAKRLEKEKVREKIRHRFGLPPKKAYQPITTTQPMTKKEIQAAKIAAEKKVAARKATRARIEEKEAQAEERVKQYRAGVKKAQQLKKKAIAKEKEEEKALMDRVKQRKKERKMSEQEQEGVGASSFQADLNNDKVKATSSNTTQASQQI